MRHSVESMGSGRWRITSWGDIGILEYGRPLRDYRQSVGPVRVFGTNGPIGWTDQAQGEGPTVIVGRKGAYRGVHYSPGAFWVIDTAFWLRPLVQLDMRWAYYQLLTQDINRQDSGSAIPSLSRGDFGGLEVALPPLHEQRGIGEVLGALDDKIESNRLLHENLRAFGLACYLEALASGTELTKVDCVAAFHNRSRAPLSARERSVRQGPYPYYGAAGSIDAIDSFLFDGTYVLVGEDGTVLVDDCHPMVQYVWGQFWVSNHAHVLTGKGISTAMLRTVLEQADIRAAVTGAVQPKLSMVNLKNVHVLLPDNRDHLDEQLLLLASLERSIAAESQSLSKLRDTLLPRLMSGELRVRDADVLVGEAV